MSSPPASPENREISLRAELNGLLQAGQLEDLAAYCDSFLEEFPQAAWLRTLGAYAYITLGRPEPAIALAAESLAMGSGDLNALIVLSNAHGQLGNHAAAAEALERVHERLPRRADIAVELLEHVSAAYGMATAKRRYERLLQTSRSTLLTSAWAKLQYRAGGPGYLDAPLLSVPAWAASRGVDFDWADQPFPIPWEEPIVAGDATRQRQRGAYPSYAPYVLTLQDATVFSKSNMVLTADGAVLNDTAADEEFGQFVDFNDDLVVVERQGDRVVLNVGQYEMGSLDACLHMAGSVSEHFGHWTSEYLTRLCSLQHHPRFSELPVLVDEQMPPQHREYLSLVIDNPIVVLPAGHGVRCKELVVAGPASFFPTHHRGVEIIPPYRLGASSAAAYEFIRERVVSRLPPPGASDRRVYLSRRSRIWRRPTNEDEISSHLEARGYEILYPEDLSFAEQVRVFQEARVIVAANGSALMNTVFCQPGTRIVVLSQTGIFNWSLYYAWAVNRGCEVIFVCSAENTGRKHDNYTIATTQLDLALPE
jgi:capsular polysaccharide biosynthesis protein